MVRENIMAEGDGRIDTLTSWQPENREKEKEGARHKTIWAQDNSRVYPSDPVTPLTQFFQIGLTS